MPEYEPFMVGPPQERDRPWRVVVHHQRTGGMALGESRIPAGTPGPGRHVHTREDEGVYIFAGTLTLEVGDQRFEAGPGCFVFMPRGIPHVFENLGAEEVRGIGLLNPPGLEDMFEEQAAYFDALDGAPDPRFFHELSARYGIQPVEGPPLR